MNVNAELAYQQQQASSGNFDLERRSFNSGPRGTRVPPSSAQIFPEGNSSMPQAQGVVMVPTGLAAPQSTGVGISSGLAQSAIVMASSSTNIPSVTPLVITNDLSNSTGSISDRELEVPERIGKYSRVGSERKTTRKRRKIDEIKVPERKITECFKNVGSSPKRQQMPIFFQNGEQGSTENQQNYTPMIFGSNRTSSSSYSQNYNDSSQSPPRQLYSNMDFRFCACKQVQTDLTLDNSEVMMKGGKSDEYKLIEDLKQQLMRRDRQLENSKLTIKNLLIEQNILERKNASSKCMEDNLRLGQPKPSGIRDDYRESWVEGYAFIENRKAKEKIDAERIEIVNASQNLRKRKPNPNFMKELKRGSSFGDSAGPSTSSGSNLGGNDDLFVRPELSIQEYNEQDEIYRLRKEHLKKLEADNAAERDRLERELNVHSREKKRLQYEEASHYNDHKLLNSRYLLLSLLGKGGFSEVWRAFDLDENRTVACKIHQVNKDWKEDKKANYVKHAMREKDIHKTLDHPRIVRLFDLFTIDNHSFCTVLEYCDGNDLDFYLKLNKYIPEKEARSIIMQVVSALRYLAEKRPPIIHYDLKPANILLQSGTTSGAIKITDFGLSKIVHDIEDSDSIELTSQGAGTYWYLPPETFMLGTNPPKISNKVDIWSVGVIFYQCLFGKRPFGDDQTQQRILEESTILKATDVRFPPKPALSAAAQDFIRRCLRYEKDDRADIFELSRHDLFRPRGQKNAQFPSSPSMRTSKAEESEL